MHRVVPCMRSIGFEPSPYPDRDDFIAYSARVWGAALWTPYGRFTDKYFGPERTVVDQHCPPLPDDPFAVFNGTLGERIIGEDVTGGCRGSRATRLFLALRSGAAVRSTRAARSRGSGAAA